MDRGHVTLVGAGCGKGLITVKGLAQLKAADVVVYDDLIDEDLLLECRKDCRFIYVGKRYGKHSAKQEKISMTLVEEAAKGAHVVRLKGGDSFVFGRGGEEIMVLKEHGIPYDVVPGITSSVAVPEMCGIPVTHRGTAQSFTVVTGHTAAEMEENYDALAQLRGTLVFLMAVRSIGTIAQRLMDGGRSTDTPASIVSAGLSAKNRRIDGTLADIGEKAAEAVTPAILVVGETAGFDFEKTFSGPLAGISVSVTGTEEFTGKVAAELTARGAFVKRFPYVTVKSDTKDIPCDFNGYSWMVFTSSRGIEIFFEHLKENMVDHRTMSHLKFGCTGPGTEHTLRKYGYNADLVPSVYTGETLGKELADMVRDDEKVLILRAEQGSSELTDALKSACIGFDDIKIYSTDIDARIAEKTDWDMDYIVFGSGSGADGCFQFSEQGRAKPVCIGDITKTRLERYMGKDAEILVPLRHTAGDIADIIQEDVK